MSDVKVQQKRVLSRQEAARFIAALAEGLGQDGKVTVELGSGTLELSVAGQVDCELEVDVDGGEIELELELKWSLSGRTEAGAAEQETDEAEPEEGPDEEPEDEEPEDEASEGGRLEADETTGDGSEQDASEQDASAENETEDGESEADAANDADAREPGEDEPVQAAVPDRRPARERRSRRTVPARAGRSTSNGVDTAAVRAWAVDNGIAVSPRGRIKEEVLKAYRDAGN